MAHGTYATVKMYGRIGQALNSKNKVDEIRLANELAEHFRQQYRRAAEIARAKN